MDLQPVDFLSGLGGLGALPNPYNEQRQVINDQQTQQSNANTIAQQGLQLQGERAKQARAAQYQTDVQSVLAKPTPSAFATLYAKYPEQQKQLQAAHDALDAPTRQANERDLYAVSSLIKNGSPDSAKTILQNRIQADKDAGQDASQDQQMLDLLNSGDANSVKSAADMALFAILPADKRAEIFGKTGDTNHFISTPEGILNQQTGELTGSPRRKFKTITVKRADGGEDVVQVPEDGFEGGSGQASGGGAPSGSGALSTRLNNPGAIRFSPNNDWKGQVGQQGGFVQFSSPEAGAAAHRKLIANQIQAGFDTPLKWAQHYAPASDGNDPQAYAATVASGLGIGINDKIPAGAVPKMAALSARVEAGGTPSPASQGRAGGGPRVLYSSKGTPGSDLSGPAFLATLPVSRQNYLRAVANGDIAAPRPGTKYGDQLAEQATNAFPGIDTSTFPARVQTKKDFTGNGKGAQNISALNRFYAHLNDAYDLHLGLGGANLGPLSGVAAGISQSFSPRKVNDYNTAIEGLQGEFQKLTKNGQGNESEAERLIHSARAAQSSEGRLGALQALAKLAAAQVEPIRSQWHAAFPEKAIPIDITPASRAIYQNVLAQGSHAIGIDKNGSPVVPKNFKNGTLEQPPAGNPVKVSSRAQAMALPSGTKFIDPNGILRVRP